jgi:hypothetical protein
MVVFVLAANPHGSRRDTTEEGSIPQHTMETHIDD